MTGNIDGFAPVATTTTPLLSKIPYPSIVENEELKRTVAEEEARKAHNELLEKTCTSITKKYLTGANNNYDQYKKSLMEDFEFIVRETHLLVVNGRRVELALTSDDTAEKADTTAVITQIWERAALSTLSFDEIRPYCATESLIACGMVKEPQKRTVIKNDREQWAWLTEKEKPGSKCIVS